MIPVEVGALVLVKQFGSQIWVARAQHPENGDWYVTRKSINRLGGREWSGHRAGQGDVVAIKAPPTYQPGDEVMRDGQRCVVLADHGNDGVDLGVPEGGKSLRGGGVARVPAGNVKTGVSKADLVLEEMD